MRGVATEWREALWRHWGCETSFAGPGGNSANPETRRSFCGDHGASAPPPSQCSGPIAAWGASEGHTLPLGTCRLGNCTLGKLPLGKLSFGRKLLWESNNKSLIFLYLKTTPIVEELIGAADACQGDSGGPMVTHEGICFLHECGSVIISARQVQTVRWWLSKIVWNV